MISTTVYLIFSVLWLMPESVTIANGQGQNLMTDVKVLPESSDDGQCPSMEEREKARNEIHQIIESVLATTTTIASTTCTTMPSTTTSAPIMSGTCDCNDTPGWRCVAFINMTDTSYNCPTGLILTLYSERTCGNSLTDGGCSSATFSVGGLSYSRVCGRIMGYQFGETLGFGYSQNRSIDSIYVNGISLTHGGAGNRQHIWTFAAGLSEVTTYWPYFGCPCDTLQHGLVPSFVGNDYFCESGVNTAWNHDYIFYHDDVLWDGQDCTANSACCEFNNPPWFTKNLPNATTNDIELRICANFRLSVVDIPVELIELYVQ